MVMENSAWETESCSSRASRFRSAACAWLAASRASRSALSLARRAASARLTSATAAAIISPPRMATARNSCKNHSA